LVKPGQETIRSKQLSLERRHFMTTGRENANPNVAPYYIDLQGKSIVQVLWLLSSAGFTVSAVKTSMWNSRPDTRCGKDEPDPPVFVVWINDGEAEKLTVKNSGDDKITLLPGHDLHYFTAPESVKYIFNDAEWCVIKSLHVMR